MPTRGFTVSAAVPASPEDVVDFLAAIERHRGLHPFLVRADLVAVGRADDGPWREYHVEERPPLGPLRYRVAFTARVVRTSPTSMRSEVSLPGCRLDATTVAVADGPHTRVEERCRVTSPRLLLPYVARQAERAHARTFSRLGGVLAPG